MALRHVLVPACLLTGMVLAAPRASAQEVQITDSCRNHFGAGVNFLTDPDGARYEDAYREFKVAYAECPSWKILGNFGLAAMKLERDGEAIDAYTKYLDGGKDQIDPAERSQYTRDLNTLKAAVAWVTLKVDQPGATMVDVRTPVRGEPVYNRYTFEEQELKLGMRPGHHKITVSVEGYQDAVWEFDAPSSATLDHSFEMKKPEVAGPTGPTGRVPLAPIRCRRSARSRSPYTSPVASRLPASSALACWARSRAARRATTTRRTTARMWRAHRA